MTSEIVKFICGPVAQLDRANGYEPLGREFESLRAHHFPSDICEFARAMNGRSSTAVVPLKRLFLTQ